MAIESRKIKCDICGKVSMEEEHGAGWPGWGQIQGAVLNGVESPALCPKHFGMVMDYVDTITTKQKEGK